MSALARIAREREIWLSRWILAEFSSAVAFKIRTRQTGEATAGAALSLLHAAIAMRLRLPLVTCDKGQADGCAYHAIGHEYITLP
ncbi:MAG: hypothetical protein WC091_12865 [Sulfuricellaceae bacterium]